ALVRSASKADVRRADPVAITQAGARVGDDEIAFTQSISDLSITVGVYSDLNIASLDYAVSHDLHACSAGAISHGRGGNGYAAAAVRIDCRRSKNPETQVGIALHGNARETELRFFINRSRNQADSSSQFACSPDLNARYLTGQKLRHVNARHFRLEFDFAVDCDHEQGRPRRREECAADGCGAGDDSAGRRRL